MKRECYAPVKKGASRVFRRVMGFAMLSCLVFAAAGVIPMAAVPAGTFPAARVQAEERPDAGDDSTGVDSAGADSAAKDSAGTMSANQEPAPDRGVTINVYNWGE